MNIAIEEYYDQEVQTEYETHQKQVPQQPQIKTIIQKEYVN